MKKKYLKSRPKVYNMILSMLNRINYFDLRFKLLYPSHTPNKLWSNRIEIVKKSPDNKKIRKHENAGHIYSSHQVMHNGLKVSLGSYYDLSNSVLISENEGIHEPQEEFAFQEVLDQLSPNSKMMELGSYWAFYSLWFYSKIEGAQCYMVEPDPHKMNFGVSNFKLNGFKGDFDLGFISNQFDLESRIPTYNIDYLMEKKGIDFLEILHSDIQGFELSMLEGAKEALRNRKIGYFFISTHSNDLHQQCIDLLEFHDYHIVCDANLDESYSWDGLIVAKSSNYEGISAIEISKRDGEN